MFNTMIAFSGVQITVKISDNQYNLGVKVQDHSALNKRKTAKGDPNCFTLS